MKYKKLADLVRMNKENAVAESFLNDLQYTIQHENKRRVTTRAYKPSGLSGCERALYYEMSGAVPDEMVDSIELIGICESGTNRHLDIQDYIMLMRRNNIDCEWLNVGKYINSQEDSICKVIEQNGNETKLYCEKYNMRFMCDGLVRYKGKLYIIEIKTESSFKFNNHLAPHQAHTIQATCYSMCIGVPRVIFIYENRDTCNKKAYLYEVPKSMIEQVEHKIDYINKCVKDNILPARDVEKCVYCKYKCQCTTDEGEMSL